MRVLFFLAPFFFFSSAAKASCLPNLANERLFNFCLLNEVSKNNLSEQAKIIVRDGFFREGYANLESLNSNETSDYTSSAVTVKPLISYSGNLNGGNNNKPIEIGQIKLTGDENLLLKSGYIIGFGADYLGRKTYGRGRYFNFEAGISYSINPTHSLDIVNAGAKLCSRNQVIDWWYIDGCIERARQIKDLTIDHQSALNLSVSKLISGTKHNYSEVSVGLNTQIMKDYTQNQLLLEFDNIHSNDIYSSVKLKLGAPVQSQLALNRSGSIELGFNFNDKPMRVFYSISKANGGHFFGSSRDEITYIAHMSYSVWNNLSATVGFRKTNSKIDYFDLTEPIFGLNFAQIVF